MYNLSHNQIKKILMKDKKKLLKLDKETRSAIEELIKISEKYENIKDSIWTILGAVDFRPGIF